MLLAHDRVSRGCLRRQPFIQPRKDRTNLGILVAQFVNKLNRKRVWERQALKIGEDMTFSDAEIDAFLPKELKRERAT